MEDSFLLVVAKVKIFTTFFEVLLDKLHVVLHDAIHQRKITVIIFGVRSWLNNIH